MDTKRANDITLLNNQIIILDAWNNWKQKTNDNYDARIKDFNSKIEDKTKEVEHLKRTLDTLDYGRSLGALILIILCAILYIVPSFIEFTKPYAPYCAVATVLFIIPYIFWARGTKKTFIAHLLYWITNGLFFGATLYVVSIKDGQPNLYYALFHNDKFDQINHIFWYLTLGSIVILILSMIIRKIHLERVKGKLNKLLFEYEGEITENTEIVNGLINEREELLLNKEKEYFGKYPLALPNYSIQEVKKLLYYMINHRADTIKEAINLNKQDEALQNIQDDVRALRTMQEKTNEQIEEMKKQQEQQEVVEEEKEDLVY